MQELSTQEVTDLSPGEKQVTVLYGSQTGNSAWLAEQYQARLRERGYEVTRCCMGEFPDIDLRGSPTLLVLISTFLNGRAPDAAVPFCEFLLGNEAPNLDGVRFSVLALGDITYKDCFCTIGRQLDARLEELGASRFYPRVECDVDFEETADAWFEGVLSALAGKSVPTEQKTSVSQPAAGRPVTVADPPASQTPATPSHPAAPAVAKAAAYSRANPFLAEVLENRNLNGPGSDRETRHLRVSLQGAAMPFQPGDSLGIYPTNHPRLVKDLLDELGYDGDEAVCLDPRQCTVREALTRHCEITVVTRGLQEQLLEWSPVERSGVQQDVDPVVMAACDLLDLVRELGLRGIAPSQLVSTLRRMPPRLYSLANSPKAYPYEAHVTISVVRYHSAGRDRYGVCSIECAERIQVGDRLPVYVNSNPYFRLPPAADIPMIMVGPGTGCAPFRAFLQEREAVGAKGDNWLFFGARRQATDFLYQEDWHAWHRRGLLTRLDTAFSRDGPQKVYVQHRMQEHGKELYAWLKRGAYLYVAGDEKRMAPNVHETVLEIIQREGGLDRPAAEEYLDSMQRDRRYQRDLY